MIGKITLETKEDRILTI